MKRGSFVSIFLVFSFVLMLALASAASAADDMSVSVGSVLETSTDSGVSTSTTASGAETSAPSAVETASPEVGAEIAPKPAETQDTSPASASAAASPSIALVAPETAPDTTSTAGSPSAAVQNYVEEKFELHLTCGYDDPADELPGIYWANRDDYLAGLLTVVYKLENSGPADALNVIITAATGTNGVTVATDPLPNLGSIAAGAMKIFTLKWNVPNGVGSFKTDLTICGDCGTNNNNNEIGGGDPGSSDPGETPKVDDGLSNPVTASDLPASLPNTGFDMASVALSMFLLTASLMLASVPVRKLFRLRRK